MNVRELIEILEDYPDDIEIELAIVAPVTGDEDIAVDRYSVEGVLPWRDEEDGDGAPLSLWLVGGEDDDVAAFVEVVEDEQSDDD